MDVIANHGKNARGAAISSIARIILFYETEHLSDSKNDSKEPYYKTEVCYSYEGRNPLHSTVDSR
jgi:hypothetical protein